MSDRAAHDTAPLICRCGRRRFTQGDLARWFIEVSDGTIPTDASGRPTERDPEWARVICWMDVAIEVCPMKHIDDMTI